MSIVVGFKLIDTASKRLIGLILDRLYAIDCSRVARLSVKGISCANRLFVCLFKAAFIA